MKTCVPLILLVVGWATAAQAQRSLKRIDNIVVIYAENRSFDVLYGYFPGAHGLREASAKRYPQVDRNGLVFEELPPVWHGLTAAGVTPPITEAQTAHLPNRPFAIDDTNGFHAPLNVVTRDLWHRFYQ